MWPNPQFPADLVTFTEEILNGKLHFLCSKKTPLVFQWSWMNFRLTLYCGSFISRQINKTFRLQQVLLFTLILLYISFLLISCITISSAFSTETSKTFSKFFSASSFQLSYSSLGIFWTSCSLTISRYWFSSITSSLNCWI